VLHCTYLNGLDYYLNNLQGDMLPKLGSLVILFLDYSGKTQSLIFEKIEKIQSEGKVCKLKPVSEEANSLASRQLQTISHQDKAFNWVDP